MITIKYYESLWQFIEVPEGHLYAKTKYESIVPPAILRLRHAWS